MRISYLNQDDELEERHAMMMREVMIKLTYLPNSIKKMKWAAQIDFDEPVPAHRDMVGACGALGETPEKAIEKLMGSSTVKQYFKQVEEGADADNKRAD